MEKDKILVVDDEQALRDAIKTAFKRENYELFYAENGEEGLTLFHNISPKVIITDLRMPVMDGIEFIKELDAHPDSPYAIIVLTGHGEEKDIKLCYNHGIYTFLRKPFNIFEIRGLVNQTIQLKKSQEDIKEAHHKLNQLDKMKDELVLSLSQNLQSPLLTILESAQLLKSKIKTKHQKYIQNIIENAEELLKFVTIALSNDTPDHYHKQIKEVVELLNEIEDEPEVAELQKALEETLRSYEK
ncbi:response regulator [Deltaproteobacteria bacterium TL4]